jgi:hypothetical protein
LETKNSSPPAWPSISPTVKSLHSLPFERILGAWDALDDGGRDRDAARELVLGDRYYLLIKVLNRYDAWHPWLYARCREVEAAPDGHIDIWFRGGYKSTTITFAGGIQEVLRDPEITIGLFSHTKPIAKSFLSQIKREFESNDKLLWLFPDVLWDNPHRDAPSWSLDAGIIVKRKSNPKEATIEAHGLVDGQPTSKHFRLMIYDDVVTLESVNTPDQIMKTTEAWSISDNLGVPGGRKQIVGTRYHYGDTYSIVLDRGAAIARIYPATDNGLREGKPVLFTVEEWQHKLIHQLDSDVACQLLCNPRSGTQSMFDVNDLQVYECRPRTLMGYLLCDPARSKKKDSANTAMVVIGIDAAGNKYLLDGFDHKMDLMERWQRFRDLYEQWIVAPGMIGMIAGYEAFGAQADLDYFREQQTLERNHWEIMELAWPRDGEGSKIDRVQRLVPDIKGHHFFLPYPTDEKRYTKLQRSMVAAGYEYRVAKPIRKLDEEGRIYDLTERFRMVVSFFPFAGRVDLIDAVSRIYDCEPTSPQNYDNQILEPAENEL